MNLPSYPSTGPTNPGVLMAGLGSFWNTLFKDRDFVKGLTTGQAEELIQRYMDLVGVVASYSSRDIPIHQKIKWYPILIYRSNFIGTPLIYWPNDAIYGPQPVMDPFYASVVFKYGFPKGPNEKLYSADAPAELSSFNVLTNNLISPSVTFVRNVDVTMRLGHLNFNQDLFARTDIKKFDIIGENGEPTMFTNRQGEVLQEQLIVLWAMNADLDVQNLYYSFGFMFNLDMSDAELFKMVIDGMVKLFTAGPSMNGIKAMTASFLGIAPIIEDDEVIEQIYADSQYRYVITDKHVYKYDLYYTMKPECYVGVTVHAGDIVVDAVEVHDQINSKNWWTTHLVPKMVTNGESSSLYFPPAMFVGSAEYDKGLIFENSILPCSADSNGVINFPVVGSVNDVGLFNRYINGGASSDPDTFRNILGLNPGGVVMINPLDFLFTNFLKYNSALVKINFKDIEQAATFLTVFPTLKACLPSHVYFIFFFDFLLTPEEYHYLNLAFSILDKDGNPILVNADGSESNGILPVHREMQPCDPAAWVLEDYTPVVNEDDIEVLVALGPCYDYAGDIAHWLFSVAQSLTGDIPGGNSISDHEVHLNSDTTGAKIMAGRDGWLVEGIVPGSTTKDVSQLLFLNFEAPPDLLWQDDTVEDGKIVDIEYDDGQKLYLYPVVSPP